MKHNINVTVFLLLLFFVSQLVGLTLMSLAGDVKVSETGQVFEYRTTALGERPDLNPKESFFSMVIVIAVGTVLALLLIKLNLMRLWKLWFFLAVFLAITVSVGVILPIIPSLIIAVILAYLKLFKPNIVTQNLSEVLVYPGIAIIFVPLLNVLWMAFLLFVISLYDMYAVWKSKHMIKLAKFQSESKTFAGMTIPYRKEEKGKKLTKTAILGGGDVAFPMLFSGVVMTSLINDGMTKVSAVLHTLPIAIFATVALALLFFKGKSDRYYPAMPFLSLGCALGYLFVLLL